MCRVISDVFAKYKPVNYDQASTSRAPDAPSGDRTCQHLTTAEKTMIFTTSMFLRSYLLILNMYIVHYGPQIYTLKIHVKIAGYRNI